MIKQSQHTSMLYASAIATLAASVLLGWPAVFAQANQAPEIRHQVLTQAPIAAVIDPGVMTATNRRMGEIVSDVLRPSFSFNGILADWPASLSVGAALTLEIRVQERGTWSDWIPMDPIMDAPTNATFPQGRTVGNPTFFLQADAFSYRLTGAISAVSISEFRDITFTYIDSRTPSHRVSWLQKLLRVDRASAEPLVHVIPRSEWGANEQYRYSGDREIWPVSYAPVEKMILHHTAGSNGGNDPAAVVRGIYYYHAVVLGWGDIGYNYLVDSSGNVYEGRVGGDGVVGGHTYNDQEHTDYNRGTIGVAFLGNFESDTLTSVERESATALLAEKAQLFSVLPTGTSTFHDRQNLPNIIAHRDVDATTCPGANIYSQLSSLRAETQTKYDALPPLPAPNFSAQLLTASPVSVAINAGGTDHATVQFTNTSNTQWQAYVAQRHATLKPLVVPSQFYNSGWGSNDTVTNGDDANVYPGAIATFSIPLAPPQGFLQATESFALFAPDGTELPGTRFQLSVLVLNADYAGLITSVSIPAASFTKTQRTVTVRIQNMGTVAWDPGDILVDVSDINGRTSQYRAKNWPSDSGGFPVPVPVAPGGSATISLTMKTPAYPGAYANIFTLKRSSGDVFATVETKIISRADSSWQAQLVSKTYPTALKTGWKRTMVVKYKNTGITTWTRKLVLRVYDAGFRPSRFSFPDWGGGLGQFRLQETSVRPGKTGTFVVKLRSPAKAGLYQQILNLEVPGSAVVVQNSTYQFLTRVDR